MTYDQALQKFGIPASPAYRDEIRNLVKGETEKERRGESGEEMLRTFVSSYSVWAFQKTLFSFGTPSSRASMLAGAWIFSFFAERVCRLQESFLPDRALRRRRQP